MPLIDATSPTVVSATGERTYPHWYLVDLRIDGRKPHPTEPRQQVTVVAQYQLCRYLQDGSTEFSPNGESCEMVIADFFDYMANNQDAADWFTAGINLLKAEGATQGIF